MADRITPALDRPFCLRQVLPAAALAGSEQEPLLAGEGRVKARHAVCDPEGGRFGG